MLTKNILQCTEWIIKVFKGPNEGRRGRPVSAWAPENDGEKKGGLSRGRGFSRVSIAKGEF